MPEPKQPLFLNLASGLETEIDDHLLSAGRSTEIENKAPEIPRGNPNWRKGGPSPNPGGRSRKLVEIEAVIDKHRTARNMREVFASLRELAVDSGDLQAYKLYLDRVLGPVRPHLKDEIDLSDAPDAVVEWFARRK